MDRPRRARRPVSYPRPDGVLFLLVLFAELRVERIQVADALSFSKSMGRSSSSSSWSCASVAADPDRHVVIGVEPRWADRVEKAREVGKAFNGVVRELIEIARASVDDDALAPRIWMPIAVMWLRP